MHPYLSTSKHQKHYCTDCGTSNALPCIVGSEITINLIIDYMSEVYKDDMDIITAIYIKNGVKLLTGPVVMPILVFMSMTCKLARISTAAARHRFPLSG